MVRFFSIARNVALAALAAGAGALLAPAPAEAQGRHGYSAGGGARFAGTRVASPRMGIAPRSTGYRHSGYRPGVRPPNWGSRPPGWRPPHYGGVWRGGYYPYWPAAAGVGLGLIGAAAVANSGYYYASDGYGAECWLERRTVATAYGRRVVNVRVCPAY